MERCRLTRRPPGATWRRTPSCSARDRLAPLALAVFAAGGGGGARHRARGAGFHGEPDAGAGPLLASVALRRRVLDASGGDTPRAAVDPLARPGRCSAHCRGKLRHPPGGGPSLHEAVLLAAILAATDPVSVFAALRRLHTPERLRVALEGESLANDGVAVLLFVVALAVVERRVIDPPGVLGLVFSQTAGGVVVGVGIGLLTRRILGGLPHAVQIVVTVLAAYAGYLLADLIGASGLLAVIAISVLLGTAYEPSTHHQVHRFWRRIGFVMSSVVFLLVGLQVRLDEVMRGGGRLLLLVAAVLLARALMVLVVTVARTDLWPWSWRLALVWAGLRGALSLALALGVPATVARHDEILVLVFGFVFLSLVVQGLSTGPVFKFLGITRQTAVTTVL